MSETRRRTPRPPRTAFLAGILGAALCAPAPAIRAAEPAGPAVATNVAVDARIDAFVKRHMQENQTPGLALAVTDRNGLLRVATYGFADVKEHRPVLPTTLFEIGSISKSFTATVLMQLSEEGRFDPRAPITRFVPWFSVKSAFRPITGHDLLTHSSGLPRDRDDIPSSLYQAAAVRDRETGSAPGTHFAYSNVGYQVLGAVVEEIEGRDYPDAIRDRVLDPVAMNASLASFTSADRPRLATGYATLFDDRPVLPRHPLVEATWLEYGAGDGSVAATPADLAAYLRVWLNRGALSGGRRLVSEDSFALMTADPGIVGDRERGKDGSEPGHYGYALEVSHDHGHTLVGHSGGMVGYTSQMLGDLDHGLGVVVFLNGPGDPTAVAQDALAVLVAAADGTALPPLPEPRDPLQVEDAGAYAGRYTAEGGRAWRVSAEDHRLWLDADGRHVALRQRSGDTFLADTDDPALSRFPVRFEREPGADGAPPTDTPRPIVALVHGPDVFAAPGHPLAAATPAPEAWQAYPGHYRTTHAWFNNFRVVLRRGRLLLIDPEGGEEALTELSPGFFRVGEELSAERLRLDTVVRGGTLRADLSGVDYYRSFVP